MSKVAMVASISFSKAKVFLWALLNYQKATIINEMLEFKKKFQGIGQ